MAIAKRLFYQIFNSLFFLFSFFFLYWLKKLNYLSWDKFLWVLIMIRYFEKDKLFSFLMVDFIDFNVGKANQIIL